MTTAYDIVGLIGSTIISAALVPQLIKVFRTKSATDVSYSFVCMYLTGLVCVTLYGFGEGLWPIYVPSVLELAGAITLLMLKIRYEKVTPVDTPEKGLVDTISSHNLPQGFVVVHTPK